MAKNVTIAGASYSDVPAVDLPQTGGGTATFTDVSGTTAQAADVAQGKQFFDALGVLTQGTASGGASSWTKVAEKTIQASTASTTSTKIDTWETGRTELWTSDKIVWVKIRDTAGRQASCFYGTDCLLFNGVFAGGLSGSNLSFTPIVVFKDQRGTLEQGSGSYGVFANTLDSSGNITINTRYHSSNSRTINGTYKIEVYLLDPAGGISPFA